MQKKILSTIAGALIVSSSAFAASQPAMPVQIVVGAYTRDYSITGFGQVAGDQVFNLVSGTYSFYNGTGSLSFSVDSSGNVTTASDGATASGNTLTLNTVALTVRPGNYSRLYEPYGGPQVSGTQQIVSIVGIEDGIHGPAGTSIVQFIPAADASLTVVGSSEGVEVSSGGIAFRNVSYTINPGSFNRVYNPYGGSETTGVSQIVGIPGMTELLYNHMFSMIASFEVDADGQINLLSGSQSVRVAGNGNTLSFDNVTLSIDPGQYPRLYAAAGGAQISGKSRLVVIPGVADQITTLEFNEIVGFVADAQGAVTIGSGSDAVTASANAIAFNTVAINVTPKGYSGAYLFFSGAAVSGDSAEVVIPGVTEGFSIAGGALHPVALTENGISVDGQVGDPGVVNVDGTDAASGTIELAVNQGSVSAAESAAESGGGCVPAAHADADRYGGYAGNHAHAASIWSAVGNLAFGPFGLFLLIGMIRLVRASRREMAN